MCKPMTPPHKREEYTRRLVDVIGFGEDRAKSALDSLSFATIISLLEYHAMTHNVCKVCGKHKKLDACYYCADCYPYDASTDLHHRFPKEEKLDREMWKREEESQKVFTGEEG